jgi:hypothetical protein
MSRDVQAGFFQGSTLDLCSGGVRFEILPVRATL